MMSLSTPSASTGENTVRQGEKRKRDDQAQPQQSTQQTEQPSTRDKIVEILSNTANGCLSELGYFPGMWVKLRELEAQNKKWQDENLKLFQDNQKLVNILKQHQPSPNPNTIAHISKLEQEIRELKQANHQLNSYNHDATIRYNELKQNYCTAYDLVEKMRQEINTLKLQRRNSMPAQATPQSVPAIAAPYPQSTPLTTQSTHISQEYGRNVQSPVSSSPSHTPMINQMGPSMRINAYHPGSNPNSNPPSRRSSLNVVNSPAFNQPYVPPPQPMITPPQPYHDPKQGFNVQTHPQTGRSAPLSNQQIQAMYNEGNMRHVAYPAPMTDPRGFPMGQSGPIQVQGPPTRSSLKSSTPLQMLNTSANQLTNTPPTPSSASSILVAQDNTGTVSPLTASPTNTLPSPAKFDDALQPTTNVPNGTYVNTPQLQRSPSLVVQDQPFPRLSATIQSNNMFSQPTEHNARNTQPIVTSQTTSCPPSVVNAIVRHSQPPQTETEQSIQLPSTHHRAPLALQMQNSPDRTTSAEAFQPIKVEAFEPDMNQIASPADGKDAAMEVDSNVQGNGEAADDEDDEGELLEFGEDGLVLLKYCLPDFFEDEGNGKMTCRFCAHYFKEELISEPVPSFINCTEKELEKHCLEFHGEIWMKTRRNEDAS